MFMFIENDFVVDNKYITTIKENLDLKDSDIIIGYIKGILLH